MSFPTAQSNSGPARTEFVLLISCVMMLVAFAIDSMLPALPAIGSSLRVADGADQPLVISAFLIGFSIALLFVGTISDRYGRRWLMLASLIGFVVTSLAAAVAPSFEALLAARAAQGMAAAGGQVLVRAVVRDKFEGREMAQIMSLAGMIFMAGPIIAPSMGQAVLALGPWRWIFIVLAALGFCVWTWAFVRLPETLPPEKRTPINLTSVAANARVVVTDRLSVGYTLAMTVAASALFGFLMSVQPIFDRTFNRADLLPTGFAIMAGGMMAASLLNAAIVKRYGMRMIGHGALIIFTLMAGIHAFVAWSGHETLESFIILQMLMMMAFPMMGGNFNAMAMERMGRVAGTASSVQGFTNNLFSAIVGTIIGRAFDGTTVPLYVAYFLCGLLALIIVFVTEGGRLFVARNAPTPAE
jgi:DHA1 family bicyclomycin/chloramphenicol resistance-like MFS transporter